MSETLRRITSICAKEFIHIVRDSRNLFLVFISPAFTLVMLSYLFAWDVDRFALGVFDQDKSSLSRQYIAALTQDESIEVRHDLSDNEELDDLLLTDRVHGVLVIPPGLMDQVNKGQTGDLQVILDGSNLPLATQMLGQLAGRTQAFMATLSALSEKVENALAPIDIRTRVWYNPNLKVLHSMVPGLVAVVMCMPAFSIATSLTREKEMGILEGLFATPVRGTELLVGKLLAYIATGLVSSVLVATVAIFWFRVPFQGNFLLFLLLTADFLLSILGLSLLLANFLPSQQAATVVLFLLLWVPSMFISGLIDPVDRISLSAQLQANFLPTTHYITISRGIFLKGVGWKALWPSALTLTVMGLAYLLLAVKLFKKKLG
jgi:ABC-type multidrug transport system permease subunit